LLYVVIVMEKKQHEKICNEVIIRKYINIYNKYGK
jgi:hypothetical protein